MRRREFITLIGAAAAWPLAARAQQAAGPVIGFLAVGSPEREAHRVTSFRDGLREAGYLEDKSVAFEFRWGEDHNDRLPELALDLARRQVTAIFTTGGAPAALAAKQATTTIPIVFLMGADPVRLGLVASLNKPGGNVTGITTMGTELGPKRLELLHLLTSKATDVALLINPTSPTLAEMQSREHQAAARALGLKLHVLRASNDSEIDGALESLSREMRPLVIGGDAFFNNRSAQLGALTVRRSLPAIYQYREFAAGGGLLSYGGSLADMYRLSGIYTARILRGEKPSDLPVQQSTRVELIVNLKTAKALSLEVPPTLLARADEVIE